MRRSPPILFCYLTLFAATASHFVAGQTIPPAYKEHHPDRFGSTTKLLCVPPARNHMPAAGSAAACEEFMASRCNHPND
jgi:hypothetical protein